MKIIIIITLITFWIILSFRNIIKWTKRFKHCTLRKTALTVDVLSRKGGRTNTLVYKPIYLIKDANNNDFIIESALYSDHFIPMKDTYYNILVNPNNYNEFIYEHSSFNFGIKADVLQSIIFLVAIIFISISI